METVNKETVRIGIVIFDSLNGEEIMVHFAKPENLMDEITEIKGHPYWKVTETFLADHYGRRL